MKRHILDACALIAVLNDEPGRDVVVEVVNRPDTDIAMHKINLLEVYYNIYRQGGKAMAGIFFQKFRQSPVRILPEITDAVFLEAGRLKAAYRISLADAIALAEASISGAFLVTSDHHEFDAVEAAEDISFLWIR
jgi:PIN domain nuclease of toxin-antitoxin system